MAEIQQQTKKTALVLGSGAARGLAHIGVLKALEEAAVPIHMIVGCSMGAMVGGAFASGLSAGQIERIACETNWLKVAQILFPRRLQRNALLDGRRMQDFLVALLGDQKIEDLKIPFACVATDIWSGEEIVMHTGSVVRAIRASLSFPFLFTPLQMGDRYLVDGGVVNPLPVSVARRLGAEFVIAVNVTPPIKRKAVRLNSGKIRKIKSRWSGRDTSALIRKLKNIFNEPAETEPAANTSEPPGIRQQMVQIGTTMENMILSLRLKENPADVLIQPDVAKVQFFDFTDARPIINMGEEALRAKLNDIAAGLKIAE